MKRKILVLSPSVCKAASLVCTSSGFLKISNISGSLKFFTSSKRFFAPSSSFNRPFRLCFVTTRLFPFVSRRFRQITILRIWFKFAVSVLSLRKTRFASYGRMRKPMISPSWLYSILIQSPRGTACFWTAPLSLCLSMYLALIRLLTSFDTPSTSCPLKASACSRVSSSPRLFSIASCSSLACSEFSLMLLPLIIDEGIAVRTSLSRFFVSESCSPYRFSRNYSKSL